MLITKLILNDYGVFGGSNQFDFTSTKEKPVILIGGTNGAGKTTIFESIILCLYGQSFFNKKPSKSKYESFLERKIHKGWQTNQDWTSITLEFQFTHHGVTDNYMITRKWKLIESDLEEILEIEKNGTILDTIEETHWQSFVEDLIPRGVTRLFFFDGEKITKISEEGEGEEIKTALNSLLGLDMVEQLGSDLHIQMTRTIKNNEGDVQIKIDELVQEKDVIVSDVTVLESKKVELNEELGCLSKEIDVLDKKIMRIGGVFANKREELKTRKATLDANLMSVENSIREICSGVLPFALIPKQMGELEETLNHDQEIVKNHFTSEILQKSLSSVQSSMLKNEFLSDLKISEQIKKKILDKFTDLLKTHLNEIPQKQENGIINYSSSDTESILSLIEKIKTETVKKLEEKTREFEIIIAELQKINSSLASAPQEDETRDLSMKLNKMYSKEGEIKNKINQLDEDSSKHRSRISLLNTQIKNMISEKYRNKNKETQSMLIEKVQAVLHEYSRILKIRKIQILENYILQSLQTLMHKDQLVQKVAVDPDTYTVKLYKDDGTEILKELLSKGEQQMFATSLLWSLAKTSGRPLPFMVDTPLARLDEQHRENLVKLFYPNAAHQVLILSTDSEINEKYYPMLHPFVEQSYMMTFDQVTGKTIVSEGYFWNNKGERIATIQ